MTLKKLTQKLFILLGVITVTLTGYTAYYFQSIKPKIQEVKRVEAVVPLIKEVTEVVQVLQKERGRSAGYIGSGGQAFQEQLKEQWKETDRVLQRFSAFIRTYNFDVLPPMVREKINEATQIYLSQLQNIRKKVWNLQISLKDELNYYTNIINSLIDATMSLAKNTPSGRITRDIVSYGSLTLAKEKEGLERAVLSVVFANRKFPNPDLYNFFVSLVSKEQAYLRTFRNVADDETLSTYNNIVRGEPVIKDEKWINLALTHPFSGELNVDPDVWFKTITDKIDLMHKVELFILNKTDRDAHAYKSEIMGRFYFTTGVLAFILVFSIVMFILTYRDITEMIREKEREI